MILGSGSKDFVEFLGISSGIPGSFQKAKGILSHGWTQWLSSVPCVFCSLRGVSCDAFLESTAAPWKSYKNLAKACRAGFCSFSMVRVMVDVQRPASQPASKPASHEPVPSSHRLAGQPANRIIYQLEQCNWSVWRRIPGSRLGNSGSNVKK